MESFREKIRKSMQEKVVNASKIEGKLKSKSDVFIFQFIPDDSEELEWLKQTLSSSMGPFDAYKKNHKIVLIYEDIMGDKINFIVKGERDKENAAQDVLNFLKNQGLRKDNIELSLIL